MRQAFHIFKKDTRYLWFEITVALLLVATFIFIETRMASWFTNFGMNRSSIVVWTFAKLLLPFTWTLLIVRVVHAEALPGDRQFWLTRPYAWRSLLLAKALFILAFVNLPLLVADVAILHAYGFSPGSEWQGLLWRQILLTVVVVIPAAALAAITTGFVQIFSACLVLFVSVLLWNLVTRNTWSYGSWIPLEWVSVYSVLLMTTLAGLGVLIWQYARKKTVAARLIVIAAAISATLAMTFLPWTTAFAIQTHLSKQKIDQAPVQISLDAEKKWMARALIQKDGEVELSVPLRMTGLPSGTQVQLDGLGIYVETQDKKMWRPDQQPFIEVLSTGNEFLLNTSMAGSFYQKVKDRAVTLRGSLYYTLYGNRKTGRIPFQDKALPVTRMGRCSAGQISQKAGYFLFCYSAFRSPLAQPSIYFESKEGALSKIPGYSDPRRISYSPFPAELSISPVWPSLAMLPLSLNLPESGSGFLIDTVEPLAHIKQDFEIGDLRLANFEKSSVLLKQ